MIGEEGEARPRCDRRNEQAITPAGLRRASAMLSQQPTIQEG
jgi:hypothetical protein